MAEGKEPAGFVESGARRMTSEEVRQRALRLATGLSSLGVGEGDCVALLLRNDIPFLETLLAAARIGAYAVPIDWHCSANELAAALALVRAKALVAHADLLNGRGSAAPRETAVLWAPTPTEIAQAYGIAEDARSPPPGALVWEEWLDRHAAWSEPARPPPGRMTLTSGTTGRPKAVRRAPIAPSLGKAYGELVDQWFGNRSGMRTAIVGPLYHSVQSIYAMAALRQADALFLPAKFSAEGLLKIIETERITHLNLVPIMMIRLLQLPDAVRARYDVSSLEFVIHGAAPCPPVVKSGMIKWWGPVLHEYYGTTEAGMMTRASSQDWLARPGTVGKAWPGRVLRILDKDGRDLPPRGEGEICASLDLLPDFTYVGDDAARAAIAREGLVASGDIGFLDEEGYLFVCDRKKDMVVSGGVNIYPTEIEAALLAHPGVADCAVFGIPSAEYGETLMAVVEPRGEKAPETEALRAHLLERLASFKAPRHYEFRRELPRDDSGKIRKQALRAPYWERTERRI